MQFYFDQPRNLLIYDRPSPLVLQHIPEAKRLNGQYVAVPRTLRNSQVLRWLNYPVAPIITDDNYDWPIEPGKKALDHQKVMTNFELLHPRCFNLSDPGTMKTQAALWLADWLMRQFPRGKFRALIIAPLTILETVWAAAIFKSFLGKRTFEILYGDANKRVSLLAKKADFQIINFDGVGVGAHTRKRFELDGFSKALYEDQDIKLVIVDEADGYCDATTKRHRIARLVIGQRPYLMLQTGTPTGNAPTDVHGLAKLVNNAFGKSFKSLRQETMYQPFAGGFKWLPQKDGYEKAFKLLIPAIRFDIRDVWKDAPPATTQVRQVELTPEQHKLIAGLKRNLQVMLDNGKLVNAANEAGARQKLLQIVLGGIYDGDHKSHAINAAPRISEIERIIEQTSRKVLIFLPLTNIVNLMYKQLSKRWRCGVINGEVPQKDRTRLIREFETEADFKCMIMDPQPTAHGINEFVVADTVIWAGVTEKTRLYEQGNKRAHRPGQKWPVTIYQIVATAFEKEVFRRLETNLSQSGALLEVVRRGEL